MGSYGRHRNTRRNRKRFAKANERRVMLAAEKAEAAKDATEIVEDTENLAVKTIDVVAEGAKEAVDSVADAAKDAVGEKADEVLECIPKSDESTEVGEDTEVSASETKAEDEAPEVEDKAPEAVEDIRANSPAKADISEKAEVAKEEPKKAKKAPAKKSKAKKSVK